MSTRTLYRPVGLQELNLIVASGYRAFPPRLADQPIFYPVTNREYAESIAKNWNAPDELCGYAGFITEFDLPEAYLSQFKTRLVGTAHCTELWVPAESLSEFNAQIIGTIRVVAAFYGEKFSGVKLTF